VIHNSEDIGGGVGDILGCQEVGGHFLNILKKLLLRKKRKC
jgi:hypothetical protein